METSLASVDFSVFEEEEGRDEDLLNSYNDSDSDSSDKTRRMVIKQNRKGKKSGGFQSMGGSL